MLPSEKFTAAQRKAMYEKAIKLIEAKNWEWGLCLALGDVSGTWNVEANFPEVFTRFNNFWYDTIVMMFRDGYWFPRNEKGNKKRVAILKKAIKRAEKLIR